METFDLIKYIILTVMLAITAYTDIKERKIKNMPVLIITAFALAFMLIRLDTAMLSLIGLAVAAAVFVVTYILSKGGLGEGDVKLAMAVGLYVGVFDFINIMLYALIYTVVAGVITAIVKRGNLKSTLPFAPFIFAGCITNIIYHFTNPM
ncbi:MAG: prepilin peptidase [Firmicutes bacterium]|nr:prepilin peptidase [Bacillota bacterium]